MDSFAFEQSIPEKLKTICWQMMLSIPLATVAWTRGGIPYSGCLQVQIYSEIVLLSQKKIWFSTCGPHTLWQISISKNIYITIRNSSKITVMD
ncbi:hypothetical protein I79_016845 [Cricetulus griseus]|uniref:Uncharacterized protein n=1 Tax=Cricetulus griseus TaxID=10029 RepID=G3I0G0_CRIGR|nr:hypothetical protein I79_016845 [Cricetulus griseus]